MWALASLLANLKNPVARSIWLEVKSDLFRKMAQPKLGYLADCIRSFLDAAEASRLESWLSIEEEGTDLKAFRALAWVDPDRAVQLLATLPLQNLASHYFGSWFPILLFKRPEKTQRALRDRMQASETDFWGVGALYVWHEESMAPEMVSMLLDRVPYENSWTSLRRPLEILSRVHRLDLLRVFEERAGSTVDRHLGELGASLIKSSEKHDLSSLFSVLLKIGGEGIKLLIQAGLGSSNPRWQNEALGWAWILPHESAATTTLRIPGFLALIGQDRALVEAIIALEADDPWRPNWRLEWLQDLRLLRRGKPPIQDEDLAPAFEALRSDDKGKQLRGLEAVAISGRADLLSHLPEWLERLKDQDFLELDWRVACVVEFLGETPESINYLAETLDFERFPSSLSILYGRTGAEALPLRLEQHLLNHRGPFGETEMGFALTLSQSGTVSPAILREVWNLGISPYYRRHLYYQSPHKEAFWKALVKLDSDEAKEELWKASQDCNQREDRRLDALPALTLLDSEAAFEIAVRHLRNSEAKSTKFVQLLLELDSCQAIPVLIEQAARERQTDVLWTIARMLRRSRPQVEREIQAKLGSPDFRTRRSAVYLAGWQGSDFLREDLQRMAAEDTDDDVQWECLRALDLQDKERSVLDLMEAFRQAKGIARWSYLESILELGDPSLLLTKEDPLWLGQIITEDMGAMEIHAIFRLEKRSKELERAAEQRDRSQA